VHADIAASVIDGGIDLAGKEPLAASIDQPLGRQLVAAGREGDDLASGLAGKLSLPP